MATPRLAHRSDRPHSVGSAMVALPFAMMLSSWFIMV
jgi:hypothetical protein